MRSVTGIELGPESCVVVRVRRSGERVELSAVRGLGDDDWEARRPLAENLAEARRTDRLPRTARVVAWGLHAASATDRGAPAEPALADRADPAERMTRTLLSPLREAGFTVEAVMSPAEALAQLARRCPRPAGRGGTVWLALNRQGAAIAIVDAGDLLYSREFDWHYRPPASVKEELLQRYSLVAHLAPEVRHGLDIVRASRDVVFGSVVTCGDLPDLRSLTMPLIEELDIEVETLDTLEGMDVSWVGHPDELPERPSALCLAAAVGAGVGTGSRVGPLGRGLVAAAAVAVIVFGGWFVSRTVRSRQAIASPTSIARAAPVAPEALPTPPQTQPMDAEPRPAPGLPPAAAEPSSPAEAPAVDPPRDVSPAPPEASRPAATSGRHDTSTPRTPVERPLAARARTGASAIRPLTAPLPQVNSILVAPDRRLAVVAGEIVREGDRVGPRVLVRIEPDAIVLREPSGHEVRVPIRRKLS